MEEVQPEHDSVDLTLLIDQVVGLDAATTDFDLVTQIEHLQTLANAAQGAIARLSVEFDASQRDEQRRRGVRGSRVGRGVADQLALARKQSPSRASRELGLARALERDLPSTGMLLGRGVIDPEVAMAIHRETTHLGEDDRRQVDADLADLLPAATPRSASHAARKAAYALDPHAAVDRAAKAAQDRAVWTKPAPDTMCTVTALLPAAQGVAVFAALRQDANAVVAAGDPQERNQRQVMADLFAERATGQATASAVPVEVQLVMTTEQLFGDAAPTTTATRPGTGTTPGTGAAPTSRTGGGVGLRAPDSFARGSADAGDADPDGPAWLNDYGPVPAALARAAIAGVPDLLGATPVQIDQAQAWIRRLVTDPITGQLTDVDSTRRAFNPTLRRFIRIRDQVCRVPFCDAPIRDTDHVHRHTDGGPTTITNGAGVCQRFNHVKETPGWTTTVIHQGHPPAPPDHEHDQRAGPDRGTHAHTIRITTPTGKTYTSTSPPVHGTTTPTHERRPASNPHAPEPAADFIHRRLTDLLAG